MKAHIFTLLYGPHMGLHVRLLSGLAAYAPEKTVIHLALNEVGESTKGIVEGLASSGVVNLPSSGRG